MACSHPSSSFPIVSRRAPRVLSATEAMAFLAVAAILDALDGRTARALNATSRMGEEIDSLADAVEQGEVDVNVERRKSTRIWGSSRK